MAGDIQLWVSRGRVTVRLLALLLAAGGFGVRAEVLLNEHFNQNVPDNSPIGGAPGWHAVALRNGVVTDYTTATPGPDYPSLSHSAAGAGSGGVGYLVMGAGNLVSNVLVWRDTPTVLQGMLVSQVRFHSRNNAAASRERIVVRIGSQWFVSTQTFSDPGGNSAWTLNTFEWDSAAASWRILNTNTLTLGATLSSPLPNGTVTGIGVFGEIHPDAGKIRIDEFVVDGIATNAPPVLLAPAVSPDTNVYAGTAVTLTVAVSGAPTLSYQWRKDGVNLAAQPGIGGVNTRSLTLSNAAPAHSGVYDLVASNPFGTNSSASVKLTVAIPTPASVDLSGFDQGGAVSVANADPETLGVTWTNRAGQRFRAEFNLMPGRPLMRSLQTAAGNGAFTTVAQGVDAKYRVTLGSRFEKAGWPYIFFDRVDSNLPAPEAHLSVMDPKSVRVISDGAHRTRLVFSTLKVGPFAGEMTCHIYDGSPFIHFQASMLVDQPWVAYIYDSLFYANFTEVAYKDLNGVLKSVPASSLLETLPGESARLLAKHRTVMGAVAGGGGTLAVMAPPHTSVYPIDFSDNYGFLQAGKTFIGTKMSYSGDNRYRPWVDAPMGSTQRMDVFLVIGAQDPAATLATVLDYTHGDFYKPIPGYFTMAEHFHPEFTANYRSGRDTITPFRDAMQAIGVRMIQLMEFHGPGHPFNDTTNRLAELKDMFMLCESYSTDEVLLIPGEEYNNWFGGHWSYMFPRPVYFTGWPSQAGRPYKMTNFVSGGVTYPLVYQVGSAQQMSQLLKDEGGIAWSSHPRIKGSRQNPDIFANSDFFKDDSFQAGDWKVMPLDLSKDRLGFRGFQLMDDVAQWGYRKAMLGEVDTFLLDPTHEIYAHMNVNYLKLAEFPSKTDWASVVDCVRNGEFFTTTGEVLIHQWNAGSTGVTATVEWYFPPAFAEVTWGDDNGVRTARRELADAREFETRQIVIPADLSNANWVRFEAWDVARNGAFTQIRWLKPPAKPAVIAGATTGFTLINADLDVPVPGFDPIPDGAVLNKAALPANLTIRANVSPLVMDSVVLNLNGTAITRTQWPYSVAACSVSPGIGDSPSYNYAASALSPGNYTLTATPYRGSTPGKPLTIHFSIMHSNPPATSFRMDGMLDSHGYQVVTNGALYAAVSGTMLYVAASASSQEDQFLFVTDHPGTLSPVPWGKAGLVAMDAGSLPYLSQDAVTRAVTWQNADAGTGASAAVSDAGGFVEGCIDLAAVFGMLPPVIYLALGRYAPGSGGGLVSQGQVPAGDGDGDIEAGEFLAIPVSSMRDDSLNGVLDTLEPNAAFTAAFAGHPGTFVVSWPSVPGHSYQVHSTDALPQVFSPISALLPAGSGMFSMSYTDQLAASVIQRYYSVSRSSSSARILSRFLLNGDAADAGAAALESTSTAVSYSNESREGNHAAEFDGVTSVVQTLGPNPVANSFSVALWMKVTGTNPGNPGDAWFNGAGLVDADTPGPTTDWGVSITGSVIAFGIGGGTMGPNVTVTSSSVNDGAWHHVVATWDAGSRAMRIYLDGQSNGSGTSSSGESRAAASAVTIGRCSTAAWFYRGLLDDIQIYDRALSAGEVAFLHRSPGQMLY